MKTPYRILHVMSRLPVGGVEQQLLNVIRNYDRSVIEPTVVSLADKGPIGREIENEGVEVIALEMLDHRFRWSIASRLRRIINERQIDIVRTHQFHANLYGRLAAKGVRCVVSSVHNQYTRDRKLHRRMLNHYLERRTHALVAVSEAVKADIVRYDRIPAEKITVIPNGVDVDAISGGSRGRARLALGIPEDAIVIGAVGRLTFQKGHRYLIYALDQLPRNVRIVIVGEGPLLQELQELAYGHGPGERDRVVFAGIRRDIPDMLAAMDIFAMPSLYEGMSNALIEAMAASKPIVASAIPEFEDVLSDGDDALLVPWGNVDALASAIGRLIDEPALAQRLGEAARAKATERYGIKATVARFTGLYTSILQGARPA